MAGSLGLFRIGSWTWRSSDVVESEIDDELDFHIACRTQELIDSGMGPQAADEEARRLFGSRDRIRRECRSVVYGRGLWLIAILAVGLTVSVATIGWLINRLNRAEKRNAAMQSLLAALPPAAAATGAEKEKPAADEKPAQQKPAESKQPATAREEMSDLIGQIVDSSGKPVSKAKVILIFKSWPNGRYTQKAFHQTSDDAGKFRFEKLYSPKMQTAFLVTILAEGHGMQSEYVLCDAGMKPRDFEFTLKPAIAKTLILQGADGRPLGGLAVWPRSRTPKKATDGYLLYDQSRDVAGLKTDDAGRVRLPFFEEGDAVELRIDKGNELIPFVVDREEQQIVRLNDETGVRGTVTALGKPVDDAKVLLIRKSWPDGQFQMEPLETKTDAAGKYRFPASVIPEIKEAFLVTIVKDGLAFESRYLLKNPGQPVLPFEFQLKPGLKKVIQVLGADGKPLAKSQVALSERKTSGSQTHMVYGVSAPAVSFTTDAEGKVTLSHFEAGDAVELHLLSGGDPDPLSFKVDGASEQIVKAKSKAGK